MPLRNNLHLKPNMLELLVRKSLFIFIAAVTAASAQKPAYSENNTIHDGQTVLLGGLFPLSKNEENKCGRMHTSAVEAVEAMVFAIRKINENSTLLPNVNLTFDIRDTCSIPNKALEQSLSYVQSPVSSASSKDNKLAVSGIVGAGFFSHVSEAVASLFRLFQIPQISYGSSASVLSDRVRFDYFFRTLPPDSFLARAMADAVNYFQWSYIIALHSDDTFGTSGIAIILEKIVQQSTRETCVAIQISLPAAGTEEIFDKVVAQMNQTWVRNASVALLYGYRGQAVGIMEAIQRLLKSEPDSPLQYLTWVGCEALRVDSKYHSIVRGMIRMQISVKGSSEFEEHFTSLRYTNASNPHFNEYWEEKYNCKIDQGSCNVTTSVGYVQKNEIPSIIDAVYAFAHAIHGLIQEHCPNGTLCPDIVVSRSAGMAINGTMIRDYLLNNLSFPGLSSDVVHFGESGNDMSSYSVKNLQGKPDGTYEYITVGTWNPVSLIKFDGKIEWNGNKSWVKPESFCSEPCSNGSYVVHVRDQADCCWTCEVCPGENTVSTGDECSVCKLGYSSNTQRNKCVRNQISYLTWTNLWAIIILICACLGIITTMLISFVYVVFHKHSIIKASSRELSGILLVGLLLCYILPFWFVTKPSQATCAIRRFAVGFSFAVCFSALLVKTNRIHRIFNRSTEQLKTLPRFISPLSQVIITLILISIQTVIAILWISIEHPSIVYAYDLRITELKCGESSNVGLIISLGYNLLLLILSTYFAFLARKIPENFNEAKFINVTLYTIIIIWLAFIPTYLATAKLSSVYKTSSLVIAIILSATTTLCCLFIPKIFLLIKQLVKGKRESKTVVASSTNEVTTKSSLRSCTDAS